MKQLVSVIIPVYNVENYLDFCLSSIVNQSYKNLEIVLVDDGSQDKSPEICDMYAKKDERIKVIHKKNGGVSDARNSGVETASGEFITFVDSDDYVCQDYVKILLESVNEAEADISSVGFEVVFTDTDRSILTCTLGQRNILSGKEALQKTIHFQMGHSVCGKLFRTSLIRELRFSIGQAYAEDLEFFFSTLLKAKKVVDVDAKAYKYLIHSGSAMQKPFSIIQFAEVTAVEKVMDQVESKYPDLHFEVAGRCVYTYFSILRWILYSDKKEDFLDLQKILEEKIKIKSKGLLLNPKIDNSLKIKILCFYLGGKRLYFFSQKLSDQRRQKKMRHTFF